MKLFIVRFELIVQRNVVQLVNNCFGLRIRANQSLTFRMYNIIQKNNPDVRWATNELLVFTCLAHLICVSRFTCDKREVVANADLGTHQWRILFYVFFLLHFFRVYFMMSKRQKRAPNRCDTNQHDNMGKCFLLLCLVCWIYEWIPSNEISQTIVFCDSIKSFGAFLRLQIKWIMGRVMVLNGIYTVCLVV